MLSLQTLRFLAAATVLIHHAGYDADTIAIRLGRSPLQLDSYFDWSFGIHLFFIVSGFIMVFAERDFGVPGAARRFVVRRVIRIVPLYWLLTTLLLLGAALAPTLLNTPIDGWRHILGSYLFIPVAGGNGGHPVLGQGWTLNFEMAFYAVFAVAMLFPRRPGLSLVAITLGALVAAGVVLRPASTALQTWTNPLLIEFLFGIAIAVLHGRGIRLGGRAAAAAILFGSLLAIGLGPFFGWADLLSTWLGQGGPAALIVAGFTLGPAWPANPLVLFGAALGEASYSLYLSHPFVIRLLRTAWLHLVPVAPVAAYLVMASLSAIIAALVLFRWVERPVTRWLQRRFSAERRRGTAPAASSA